MLAVSGLFTGVWRQWYYNADSPDANADGIVQRRQAVSGIRQPYVAPPRGAIGESCCRKTGSQITIRLKGQKQGVVELSLHRQDVQWQRAFPT